MSCSLPDEVRQILSLRLKQVASPQGLQSGRILSNACKDFDIRGVAASLRRGLAPRAQQILVLNAK
jgi:hypothetical protein